MHGKALVANDILPAFQAIVSKLGRSVAVRQDGASLRDLKVGVCVSGGPDSMALAYLMNTLPVIDGTRINPVGLIVDHHVRPGSTEEALQVQQELDRIGVASKILSMSWPQDSNPLKWSNFESEARKKRYRLIAFEALLNQIRHIFTGHHMDDQVETGIMRLAYQQNDNLLGLRGISSVAPIPCCDDIYGAHEEQGNSVQEGFRNRGKTNSSIPSNLRTFNLSSPAFFPYGGLSLHRPLLGFCKSNLIATCDSNNVPFVTDKTNTDPTFTKRNAIRSLRSTHRLPEALQAKRVLELQSRANKWTEHVRSSGSQVLQSCLIHKFSLTSGVMKVELPAIQDMNASHIPGLSNAIARLIDIITPFARSEMPLQVPDQLVSSLFPASARFLTEPAPYSQVKFRHTTFTNTASNTWVLSRQPMRPEEVEQNTWQFLQTEIHSMNPEIYQTTWKLWDNRFWIRISCSDPAVLQDLTISPLTMDNLSKLNSDLVKLGTNPARMQMAKLKKILRAAAPEKIRFTLPVVLQGGEIVSFPTLNFYVGGSGSGSGFGSESAIRTEVRYKTLRDLEYLRIKYEDKNDVTSLSLCEIPGLRSSG